MVKSRFFLPNILNFYMKYNNCVILTELATRMFNLLSNVYVLSTYQVLATCTNCVCRLPRQDLSHSDLWHIQQSHVKTCTQPQTIRWTSHKRYGGLLPNVTGKYINIESCGKFQTLHTTSSILNLLVNFYSIPSDFTILYRHLIRISRTLITYTSTSSNEDSNYDMLFEFFNIVYYNVSMIWTWTFY